MGDDSTGLEEELRANGIDVESLAEDGVVTVTYTTAFPGERVHRREMGRACRTFLALARGGEWEPIRVEATVERSPGDVQGRWYVEPAWIRGWVDYRLSDEEFTARVVGALEEVDDDALEGADDDALEGMDDDALEEAGADADERDDPSPGDRR